MAQLARGLELLGSALSYALDRTRLVTPQLLERPTPCAGWDLAVLLHHVSDSIDVLDEAITAGRVVAASALPDGPPAAPGAPGELGAPGPDPVSGLHLNASRLLTACAAAAGPGERVVRIGDRQLTASMAAVAGAIEITVHGWDISVACGALAPVPAGLAAVLLPVAPLFITPQARPGLFADPVQLTGPAFPGDQLVAFLGRHPR